jgi:hypothetical protein
MTHSTTNNKETRLALQTYVVLLLVESPVSLNVVHHVRVEFLRLLEISMSAMYLALLAKLLLR